LGYNDWTRMKCCQARLYQSPAGISGDVNYPDGNFGTGCYGVDSQTVVDSLCRIMEKYPRQEVTVRVELKRWNLRKCDKPLDEETLAEIRQLLCDQDYKVR